MKNEDKTYLNIYQGNAYDKLSSFYDEFKYINVKLVSFDDFFTIWNDYQDIEEELIDFQKAYSLDQYITNRISRRVKLIKDRISETLFFLDKKNTNTLDQFQLKRDEISDAFDFELSPRKLELKSSTKPTPKTSKGRKEQTTKDITNYMPSEWDEKSKNLFKNEIKNKFKFIKEDYQKGKKQSLNLLTLCLVNKKIIETATLKNEFESVKNIFFKKSTATENKGDQTNYNNLKKKGENNYKDIESYTTIKKKIETIKDKLIILN